MTYTTGSDASAGFLVADEQSKKKIKIKLRSATMTEMVEAAMRGIMRAAVEMDETITPLAHPAPVPYIPNVTREPDPEETSKAVIEDMPVSPKITEGEVPALVGGLARLGDVIETQTVVDLQDKQDQQQTTSKTAATAPEYRPAEPNAVEMCANCHFFIANSSNCHVFDFQAQPNHVCSVWKPAPATASYVKAVPQINAQGRPIYVPAVEVAASHTGKVRGGEVIQRGKPRTARESGLSAGSQFAHTKPPELSKPHGKVKTDPLYYPSERVYSKSLRRLGEVVNSEVIEDQHIYTLKLIDRYNAVDGYAVVQEEDLQPRSTRAMKRIKSNAIRSDIENKIKALAEQLKTVCQSHKDYKTRPIPVTKLEAIETVCKDMLNSPDFVAVGGKTDFRKYIRALQDIQHGVSAATHLIQQSKELAKDAANERDSTLILRGGQKNAYTRCVEAMTRAEESLMDPVPMRTLKQRPRGL